LRRRTGNPLGRAHVGQRVRIPFALDTSDPDRVSCIANTGSISGKWVLDVMLEGVGHRFADSVLPQPFDWLSANGSRYRAHETSSLADSIGLARDFASVRSLHSSGIAKLLVKTFERGYAYVRNKLDRRSGPTELPRCFEDHKDSQSHKARRPMKLPREFLRSFQQPVDTCAD
jgi:putative transposase